MQFSLRTFLIGVCVTGLSIGVLGHLFRRDPESFLEAVEVLSTIVPFVLAIGTLVWLGLRRRPLAMEPLCGQCREVLRARQPERLGVCPACGAALDQRQAILFRRRHARPWGLVVWAGLLVLVPLVGGGTILGVHRYYRGSRPDLILKSTTQLIQQLPNDMDSPWLWEELERRGISLSAQEADDAVNALVNHMTTQGPNRRYQLLYAQLMFLRASLRRGVISEPILISLCDAFHGQGARFLPSPRLREGEEEIPLGLSCDSDWSAYSTCGVTLLWRVSRVFLDGKPIQVREGHKRDNYWMAYYHGSPAVGEHEVSLEVDYAYVDTKLLNGQDPSESPVAKWPKAHKQWKQTLSAPLTVYSAEAQLVAMTTDGPCDPGPDGGVAVERLRVWNDKGQKQVSLQLNVNQNVRIPLSYDVAVVLNGQSLALGHIASIPYPLGRRYVLHNVSSGSLQTLDPPVVTADVLLTPNPRHIERQPDVSEIWGKPTVLRNVPVERLDLEPSP